jgi:hypothetical protein
MKRIAFISTLHMGALILSKCENRTGLLVVIKPAAPNQQHIVLSTLKVTKWVRIGHHTHDSDASWPPFQLCPTLASLVTIRQNFEVVAHHYPVSTLPWFPANFWHLIGTSCHSL